MDKINGIKFLIQDAKEEFTKIENWTEAIEGNRSNWNLPRPSRQRIKDELKMVRRLSLELEKEAEKLW